MEAKGVTPIPVPTRTACSALTVVNKVSMKAPDCLELSPVDVAAWRPEGPVHHDLHWSLGGDPDHGAHVGLVTGHLEAVVSLEVLI